ncbi:cytochrome c [Breoghania sp. JC706]|uniref:c-type cytochrome n=1 Tax=Breoghania sp. JC706 TaxID=3117732 RepID=UPI00300AB920
MTHGWKGALVGALAALAWAVAFTVVADSAEKKTGEGASEVELGRALAESECASCHAIGAEDESPLAEAPAFRDLAKRYPVEDLEEALAEGIVTGHEGMPEIAWEPEQITAFIAYLKSL